MSEWKPIDEAEGNDPHDDEMVDVLLTDGKLRKIGWVLRRPTGAKRGMVSGHHGHNWTHWQPLPDLPTPSPPIGGWKDV